ncbi:hypothetical protein E2C01_045248 [Portunus trituberculatus]|uniref:Uncharacterized protein n=1 Tax=Portunus trituberculatus TaxID=210409 RepID=A0A5B7G4I6_PORTR|nr:hypothetical protein [Portunus trituberculatus]
MTPCVTHLPEHVRERQGERAAQGTTRRQGSISVTLAMGESSVAVEVITPVVSDSNSPLLHPLSVPLFHNPNRFHSILCCALACQAPHAASLSLLLSMTPR